MDNIPHRQRLPPTADVRRAVLSPFVLIVILIACLFTSSGCRRDTPEADSNAKNSLTIAMVEPSTIDPSRLADSPGRKIASNLFVGLTALNDKAEVIPGCSDTWKSSDDARRWEFAVRGDMRWSDGTPITAHTFREAWLRATHPKTENPMAEMFDFIQGAAKRRAGDLQAKFGVIAEESDLKVTIHTVRPMPDLPRRLAQPWAAPVPMHVISKHGQRWTSPKHIVVNGPYALSAHRPGTSMTFVRNTSSRVAATIGTVHTLFTDSPLDAQRWFELKKVDWADNLVPKDAIASLRQQKNSPLQTTPYLGLTYIIPNHARPAMDLAFRRALNLSIDRRRLVKHVLDGSQLPLSRPIPRSLLESPPGPRYEPALGRRILATSSTTRATAVELSFYNGGRNPELAAALQRVWKEALGIEIRLRGMEWKTFLSSTASGDFDLALFTLGGYDAEDLLSVFASKSPNNRGAYRSTNVDKNLRAATLASTPKAHKRALAKVEAALAEDVAVIGLFQLTRHSLVRQELKGWNGNTDDHHPWNLLHWN